MVDYYTGDARQSVIFAYEAARSLRHEHLGSEHLLLGLLTIGNGNAYEALTELGIDIAAVQTAVLQLASGSEMPVTHRPDLTPLARTVLESDALREALALGDNKIDAHHILLGLSNQETGVCAHVFALMGISREQIRARVITGVTAP